MHCTTRSICMIVVTSTAVLLLSITSPCAAQEPAPDTPPKGFTTLFNGQDLTGWKGLVSDPIQRAKLSSEQLAEAQKKADEKMRAHWSVENGILVFDGKGDSICTARDYADFEMLVDWKIKKDGDSGIYLRGSPQVQIWDPALRNVGSGGLFNNEKGPSQPLVLADNPVGQWNTFRIRMLDEKVTIWLNDKLVVDNVVLENYWDRKQPIFPTGQIELQNHGNRLEFRNIFIRELVTADDIAKITAALPKEARVKPQQPRKLLIFTRAAGFVHASIPHGARAIKALGRSTGAFESEITDDPPVFDADRLKQFDAIFLDNTTGDWLLPAKDALAKMSPQDRDKAKALADQRRQNILQFVEGGKGLAGVHSASDSQYDWPAFGRLIGGYFDGHPWHEKVKIKLDDPQCPLCKAFDGKDFTIEDEIYQFRDPYSRELNRVLLSLDTTAVDTKKKGVRRTDNDFAVAWIHPAGKGRVFYSSLGHRPEIFWNPTILAFYLDGLQYALGDLPADAAPKR